MTAREVLYRLVSARIRGELPSAGDLAELSRLVAAAHEAGVLATKGDGRLGWTWSADELASVRHSVVDAATELLAEAPEGRLKECPGDRCGWLFLDSTNEATGAGARCGSVEPRREAVPPADATGDGRGLAFWR